MGRRQADKTKKPEFKGDTEKDDEGRRKRRLTHFDCAVLRTTIFIKPAPASHYTEMKF